MKFLAPTCVFVMLCIFACGGVEKAGDLTSMDGSPSGVASTGVDQAVKVSGGKSEIQPTGFGPAQGVDKELDAYEPVQDDSVAKVERRNCCFCEGGHWCCGITCAYGNGKK